MPTTGERAHLAEGPSHVTITVREYRASDVARVAELRDEAVAFLRRTYRPGAALVAARGHDESCWRTLVADSSAGVVGTVEYKHAGGCFQLRLLAVTREHQRVGVARALVAHLTQHAPTTGTIRLTLYTIAETGNVPILERLGFHVVETAATTDFESDSHLTLHEVQMELNTCDALSK